MKHLSRTGSSLVMLLVILLVVVAIAGGAAYYFFIMSGSKPTDQTAMSPQSVETSPASAEQQKTTDQPSPGAATKSDADLAKELDSVSTSPDKPEDFSYSDTAGL